MIEHLKANKYKYAIGAGIVALVCVMMFFGINAPAGSGNG